MHTRIQLSALATTLVLLGTVVLASPLSVAGANGPTFNPNNFDGRPVDNPWFPLTPGTTLVYKGTKDGKKGTDIFKTLHRRHMIGGVSATVVEDTTILAGRISEHTFDYYAQDIHGNVWYLGERTAEYDRHGNVVSREGSWATGVDGAQPGIFMPAHPKVGDTFRQEYYPGHAEDHFRIMSMDKTVWTPYATFQHAMRTREWTPLEPGTRDAKYYAKGIGEVAELTVIGAKEVFRLAQVITD
jgi:hypothetical protein